MDLNRHIKRYLVEKRNLVKLVVLTALFSLFFINVFEPYNSRDWLKDMSDTRYFLLSSLLVLIGMGIVAVSRIWMYHHCKKGRQTMPLWHYLLWIAGEIVVISFAFTILEIVCFHDTRPFGRLLRTSFDNTSLILLLPYSVIWLYFSWSDKDRRLKAIEEYRHGVVKVTDPEGPQEMINIHDQKGDLKLSVKAADLVYIKGADNYVTIHYMDGEKMGQSMIRTTLKTIEEQHQSGQLIRCNKSYVVNKGHIKLFEKTGRGFVVRLDTPTPMSIQISEAYVSDVYELFG